ncbi:MAG: RnfABCDGE type electron transport complex subunit A [Clostridia bacterium]|nr:RnfABCDGE type electron transport complex subunit A [Clostridia bacterium]MBQ7604457.1 RnfABCDGE type electron transport complex subunit A [Clostridia bacterium]
MNSVFAGIVIKILSAALVNNVVLSRFLGLCPFLGVSKKTSTAVGMGSAVTVVVAISSAVTFAINRFILIPLDLVYLRTIVYILIIAALVQSVEIILKKKIPSLYNALGVYLPLITTNCAVLGVSIDSAQKNLSFGDSMLYSVGTAIGFFIAIVLMSGIREKIEFSNVPKAFKGTPIVLIIAGLMAIAFYGFAGAL